MTNLNNEQRRAVNHIYGPCLVLAGPGSGKTFTLVERIRHMVEDVGISPKEILVITFSKKAAVEMQERFELLTSHKSYPVYFGTFHAVFYNILKNQGKFNNSSILTEKLKIQYMRRALKNISYDIKDDSYVLEQLELASFYKNNENSFEGRTFESDELEKAERIVKTYIEICQKENKIDFDDMLNMCKELLILKPEIKQFYQKIYKYILVDEFQDINKVQYDVLCMLSGTNNNVFAVGDDDQSIYGFRGSKPELMKRFLEENKRCEVINLNKNYRCAAKIIEAAGEVIGINSSRIDKTQVPCKENKDDGFVSIEKCGNASVEADFVCEKLIQFRSENIDLSSVAIIFRTFRCIELLKEKMNILGIPYTTNITSDNFYELEWMKDIIAYIRIATGSRDKEIISRIINKPDRGLDREDLFEENTISMRFFNEVRRLSNMNCYAAVSFILKAIGYEKYLYSNLRSKGYDDAKIDEIIDEVKEKSKLYENLSEWLSYIDSLALDKNNNEDKSCAVNLLSAHASKGLEFDTVFVVGLQEGVFPHNRAMSEEQIEEERRLLYVAMTRAKKYLYLVGRGEKKHGKKISRFLYELEERMMREV